MKRRGKTLVRPHGAFRAPGRCPERRDSPEARAPRFNLKDPATQEKVRGWFKRLESRTYEHLEVFHYLQTPDAWWCLDLNLSAPDRESLDAMVVSEMAVSRRFIDICPPAPRALWLRMVEAPVLRERMLMCPGSLRRRYLIAACSEVANADNRK